MSCTFVSSPDAVLNNVISGCRVASSSVASEYLRNICLKLRTLFLVKESQGRQRGREEHILSRAPEIGGRYIYFFWGGGTILTN